MGTRVEMNGPEMRPTQQPEMAIIPRTTNDKGHHKFEESEMEHRSAHMIVVFPLPSREMDNTSL